MTNQPILQNFSMKARLLPFMEQMQMYNALNFMVSSFYWYNPDFNQTVRRASIATFLCPSDTNPGNSDPQCGVSSYAENLGPNRRNANWALMGPTYFLTNDGVCYVTTNVASISDGLSNTAGWSEFVKGNNGTYKSPSASTYTSTNTDQSAHLTDTIMVANQKFAAECQLSTQTTWDYRGEYWILHDGGRGGGYNHIQTPNRKACYFGGCCNQKDAIVGPSSKHSGGVNMMFLDGSVKFIKDSISYPTWYAIGTRDSGEVFSADSL